MLYRLSQQGNWDILNAKAKMNIEETVRSHILDEIDGYKTAREQWLKLTAFYKPDEEATKNAINKKLKQLCNKHPWSPEEMDAHWA